MDLFKTKTTEHTILRSILPVHMLEWMERVGEETPVSGDDLGWINRVDDEHGALVTVLDPAYT